jgi:caspase domain-containing protein
MDRTIRDFAEALAGAQVDLFFYAGHGLQLGGQNYLVPIDAKLTTASAIDFEMVRLDLVHRTMDRESNTNISIMDACRDNPLARNLARALGDLSNQAIELGRALSRTPRRASNGGMAYIDALCARKFYASVGEFWGMNQMKSIASRAIAFAVALFAFVGIGKAQEPTLLSMNGGDTLQVRVVTLVTATCDPLFLSFEGIDILEAPPELSLKFEPGIVRTYTTTRDCAKPVNRGIIMATAKMLPCRKSACLRFVCA